MCPNCNANLGCSCPRGVAGLVGELQGASLVAQLVKNLPTMQETRVRFLGQKDLLEKEMATRSSILAYRIPWTEEPGMGSKSRTELSN